MDYQRKSWSKSRQTFLHEQKSTALSLCVCVCACVLAHLCVHSLEERVKCSKPELLQGAGVNSSWWLGDCRTAGRCVPMVTKSCFTQSWSGSCAFPAGLSYNFCVQYWGLNEAELYWSRLRDCSARGGWIIWYLLAMIMLLETTQYSMSIGVFSNRTILQCSSGLCSWCISVCLLGVWNSSSACVLLESGNLAPGPLPALTLRFQYLNE